MSESVLILQSHIKTKHKQSTRHCVFTDRRKPSQDFQISFLTTPTVH